MGIVNITPDSFSDGGKFSQIDVAVEHALNLANQGATILDIGGESTRPYSTAVEADQELARVIPVIEELVTKTKTPISIDTSKSVVAAAAIAAGAQIINDVTGLQGDPKMIDVALQTGAGICAMHMQGTPATMQERPTYKDITTEVLHWLQDRMRSLRAQGIQQLAVDVGFGFGKTAAHNFQLLRQLDQFQALNAPLLVGVSRKSMIYKTLDGQPETALNGTTALHAWALERGAHMLRVHDVAEAREVVALHRALRGAE